MTAPSNFRRQRAVPIFGPVAVDAPLWRESCSAAGHGVQLADPGAVEGTVTSGFSAT
ncbi:MAG TPA: hypothetical protein VF003_04135 [Pseudonocardiaceae bacterium]